MRRGLDHFIVFTVLERNVRDYVGVRLAMTDDVTGRSRESSKEYVRFERSGEARRGFVFETQPPAEGIPFGNPLVNLGKCALVDWGLAANCELEEHLVARLRGSR